MNPDRVHFASKDDKKDREGDTFNSIVMLSSAKHLAEPLRLRSGPAWSD